MTSPQQPQSRWRWREISPRRMAANFLVIAGPVAIGTASFHFTSGEWNPAIDWAFVIGGAIATAVGLVLSRGVKPAPWP